MATETYNEAIFDAMLRHQTGLLRFSGAVRNRVWKLLDATETDIARAIRRADRAGLDTPVRLRVLERLLRDLRETRLRGWNGAREAWFEELRELARVEPKFVDGLVKSAAAGVELGTALPPPVRLRAIVSTHPFEGRTMAQWADKVRRDDLERIESAVKVGLVQGESGQQIARRVVGTVGLSGRDGVTQVTRRQAAAITRTAVSSISSEARQAYFAENADLAPRKLFTATLDARTTAICRSLDGRTYAVDDPKAPVLPLHWNERSVYSPLIDGEVVGQRPRRDFTQRQLLREFTAENGISTVTKRGSLPRGTKGAFDAFARRRMRELTGRTAAKTTYGQWLGRQSAAFQDDVLGPTRGALFRRGGLKLDRFVMRDGSELTLPQLAQRHAEAFRAAGLDPADFL